jgi:hypothetical protein
MPAQAVKADTPLAVRRPKGRTVTFVNQSIATTGAWIAAKTYTVGQSITDPCGAVWTVTSVSGTGTSGASNPFPTLTVNEPKAGSTITDNPGANQIVWTLTSNTGVYLSEERSVLSSPQFPATSGGVFLPPGGTVFQWPNFPGLIWVRGAVDMTALEVTS